MPSNQRQSPCQERLLNQDSFGQSLAFNFPDGASNHRSKSGACLSLLATLVTWTFFLQNMVVLEAYHNTTFVYEKIPNAHDENYSYSEEQGLQFAIGYAYLTPEPGKPHPSDIFDVYMRTDDQQLDL